jgi:Spy/CpxP family protein refolding chaperone
MKLKLITLTAISALSLGTIFAQTPQPDQQGSRGGRGHRHHSLDQLAENLNLTPAQQAKVQPIIDQAKPQIENIRLEAMQKTKAVMDNAMAQIRPLLTPDQQKKLEDAQNDRRSGRDGRKGGRRGNGGQGDQGDEGSPDDK